MLSTLYGLFQLIFTTPAIGRLYYYPHLICSWHYVKERAIEKEKDMEMGVAGREREREKGARREV